MSCQSLLTLLCPWTLAPGDTLKPWIALLPDGESQTRRVLGGMKTQWPLDEEMKPQVLTCKLPTCLQPSVAEQNGKEGMKLVQPHRGQKEGSEDSMGAMAQREAQVRSWGLGNRYLYAS